MTAKEYLQQAFTIRRLIKAKESRIQELRDMTERVGQSLSGDGVRVQTSPRRDPMGDLIATLVDLERECLDDYARLLALQSEIENAINSVERHEYRLVLYERYINLKRWDDIAEDNNYGYRHVYRLHDEALAVIENGNALTTVNTPKGA